MPTVLKSIAFALVLAVASTAAIDARPTRSQKARRRFMAATGYPHGRPGYVIDHIVPLACGGSDTPGNMQWQTTDEAKAKDRWERTACGHHRR